MSELKTKTKTAAAIEVLPLWLRPLVEDLHPACAALIARCFTINANAIGVYLDRMWQQGKAVKEMDKTEYQRNKDGTKPVNPYIVLAEALETSESFLYKTAQLYQAFSTEKERMRMLKMRLADGRPLTWNHFEQLLKFWVPEAKEQPVFEQLLRRTIDENLSPEVLEAICRAGRPGGKGTNQGGRPVVIPKTFHGRVTKLIDQSSVILSSFEAIYSQPQYSLLAAVQSMATADVASKSSEMINMVNMAEANVRRLLEHLTDCIQNRSFEHVREHILAVAGPKADASGRRSARQVEVSNGQR